LERRKGGRWFRSNLHIFINIHQLPFPEIITFFGTDFNDIHNLQGEDELWVEGKPYNINKSFDDITPEEVEHGPLTVRNVRKPVFHYTVSHAGLYTYDWFSLI
jgi:hypothetical protein